MIVKKIAIICFCFVASLAICSLGVTAPSQKNKTNTILADNTSQNATSNENDSSNNEDKGKFILKFIKYDESPYKELYDYLTQNKLFVRTIDNFNKVLKLPKNLDIIFDKSEDAPYYDPNKEQIVMGYEMFFLVASLYEKASPDETAERAREDAINVNRAFLYHELGHALIHTYDLPIVGDEETTADNLSTIIALNFHKDGLKIILDVIDFYDLLAKAREESGRDFESEYWDEHRLDEQRYYYVLCLAYGKYPEEVKKEIKNYYDDPVMDKFLAERANYCREQYEQSFSKWMKVLKPHMREDALRQLMEAPE